MSCQRHCTVVMLVVCECVGVNQHFSVVVDTHRPAGLMTATAVDHNQLIQSAQKEVMDSFEEAARKAGCRPVVKTAHTGVSMMMQQHHGHANQVSDTGKELWQSLANATSLKRSPAYRKSADSDSDKSGSKQVVESTSEKVVVTKDAESGDGSCNTSPALSVVIQSVENGAGDAKMSTTEEPVTLNGGWARWQTVELSVEKPGDDSIGPVGTAPVDVGPVGTAPVDVRLVGTASQDISEVMSGEDSFYSVTSGDHHPEVESDTAAETNDDDDDDVGDDETHVNYEDHADNGTNVL